MNSVEGPSLRSTAAAAAPPAAVSRVGSDGPDSPAPASVAGGTPAGPVADTPVPSLAALLDQARAAQAALADQPLPITNHHHRFIMNLFGG